MANTKEYPRSDRIAQLLSRSLANLLLFEVNDERVKRLSVVEVKVTQDLRHADVFLFGSQLDDEKLVEESMAALNKAKVFLKSRLVQSVDLRRCPDLHFKYDYSIVRGQQLSALIDSVKPSPTDSSDQGDIAKDQD